MTDAADSPLSALDDRALVRAMRNQGSRSFEVLFKRHARVIHAYIRTHLVDSENLEDVFQEVFTRAWAKLDAKKMRGDSALPWLILTARNLVSNANDKALSRTTVPLSTADLPGSDNAFAAAVDAEATMALSTAIAKLNNFDRQIVASCLVDKRLYKEVAYETDNSISVIRNRLWRVRRFLRGELAPLRGDE